MSWRGSPGGSLPHPDRLAPCDRRALDMKLTAQHIGPIVMITRQSSAVIRSAWPVAIRIRSRLNTTRTNHKERRQQPTPLLATTTPAKTDAPGASPRTRPTRTYLTDNSSQLLHPVRIINQTNQDGAQPISGKVVAIVLRPRRQSRK